MIEHVGLFLPLPQRLAKQYPPEGKEGEDTSPPHLTLVYIGDVEEERLGELEAVLRRICQAIPPLDLELLPPRTFQNESGQTILHSQVGCPILELVHRSIRMALERRGFHVDHFDQFKPHVTIEYIDPGESSRFSYLAPRGRWRADSVGFWAGDNRKQIPLGYRRSVHAAAADGPFYTVMVTRGRTWSFVHTKTGLEVGRITGKRRAVAFKAALEASKLTDWRQMAEFYMDWRRQHPRGSKANAAVDPELKQLTDELERFGKTAIDMVAKRKPMDIGAVFKVTDGKLTFYSDSWNGTNPETRKRLIDLKYQVGNALKSKTRRRILDVKQGGKKLWTHGVGSFGTHKFVDGYTCAIELELTPAETNMLMGAVAIHGGASFKSFSHKPIITPPPRRNEPDPEPEPILFAFLGKTFPNKALLKRLGAKWNGAEKAWLAPEAIADKILAALDAEKVPYRVDGYDVWLV